MLTDAEEAAYDHEEIARMEVEAGCELPELSDATLADRARRLLDCSDPPRGEDAELCRRFAE